jgi:hypothetical protein
MTTSTDLQEMFETTDAATNDECDMMHQGEQFALLRAFCYRLINEQTTLAIASSEEHNEFHAEITAANDIASVCTDRIAMIDNLLGD